MRPVAQRPSVGRACETLDVLPRCRLAAEPFPSVVAGPVALPYSRPPPLSPLHSGGLIVDGAPVATRIPLLLDPHIQRPGGRGLLAGSAHAGQPSFLHPPRHCLTSGTPLEDAFRAGVPSRGRAFQLDRSDGLPYPDPPKVHKTEKLGSGCNLGRHRVLPKGRGTRGRGRMRVRVPHLTGSSYSSGTV